MKKGAIKNYIIDNIRTNKYELASFACFISWRLVHLFGFACLALTVHILKPKEMVMDIN